MGNLLAGAAKRCITPSPEMMEAMGRRWSGVYTDIYVRVIVVSDGKTKVVLAGADCGQFPMSQLICDRLVKECGIDPMGFIVSATHNHGAMNPQISVGDDPRFKFMGPPPTAKGDVYAIWAQDQVVDAVKEAIAKLQPARMGVNRGESFVNACRDLPTPIGGVQANNFHGPTDHSLLVLRFETLEGETIGMFVNHATHSNFGICSPGNPEHLLNADFGGGVSRYVEKANKNQFPVIWAIAFAGDQSPIIRGTNRIVRVDDEGNFTLDHVFFPFEVNKLQIDGLIYTQGLEILELAKNMTEYTDEFSYASAETHRYIPARMSYQELKIQPLCNERPEPVLIPDKQIDFHFHLSQVCGVAFAQVNNESYANLGHIVRNMVPSKYTFLCELAYGCQGYIPDVEGEKVNGFGTMNTNAINAAATEAAYKSGYAELIGKVYGR